MTTFKIMKNDQKEMDDSLWFLDSKSRWNILIVINVVSSSGKSIIAENSTPAKCLIIDLVYKINLLSLHKNSRGTSEWYPGWTYQYQRKPRNNGTQSVYIWQLTKSSQVAKARANARNLFKAASSNILRTVEEREKWIVVQHSSKDHHHKCWSRTRLFSV